MKPLVYDTPKARGIAHNPFATRYVVPGKIPFCEPWEMFVDDALNRWQASGCLGQIVGPHGSGKTTLASHLARRNERFGCFAHIIIRGHNQIKKSASIVAAPGSDRPRLLIVDGIERLSWLHRWALIRYCAHSETGLILTTHKPHPWVRQIATLKPTLEIFQSVVGSIVPGHSISVAELETAFQRCGGNIRESLMLLYDYWEQQR